MESTKGCYIGELRAEQSVTLLAAIKQKDLRVKQGGERYFTFTLCDRTGEVEAVKWDTAEVDGSTVGEVWKFKGQVGAYRGKLQLKIDRARKATDDEVDRADFVACSAFAPDEMLAQLRTAINGVQDESIKALLNLLIVEHEPQLLGAPAAQKIHHCFAAGLLEHMLSMTRVAEQLCLHYTRLNRDLLLAGVVLHDFGKLEELQMDLHISYTVAGQMVGHIGLGLVLLERYAAKVGMDAWTKSMLQHLIVSHHGSLEFGALRLPMTPEAIALHYIDEMDARLEQAFRMIDTTPDEEEFTPWVPAMGRVLYRGKRS